MQQMIALQNVANVRIYEIMKDEEYDPTLVSLRLYGTRIHANVIMVICGTNGIWEALPVGKKLAFPQIRFINALRAEWDITT